MIWTLPFFPRSPRGLAAFVLATLAWITSLTVVEKCTTSHTMTIHADLPARASAQGVQGTTVASARLTVPRRDTIIIHDTIATTRIVTQTIVSQRRERLQPPPTMSSPPPPTLVPLPLITRTAHFRDSTFAGLISGDVTAPPDPAPLGITYHLTRPSFNPTITFLTTTSHPLVVVSWQGEQVTVDRVTIPSTQPRWLRAVDLTYTPTTRTTSISGVLGLRVLAGLSIVASVTQPVTALQLPTPALTLRREF